MSKESKLRDILHHHKSHDVQAGEPGAFVDVYVEEDVLIQFGDGLIQTQYGTDSEEQEAARQVLDSTEEVEQEGDLGWWIPNATDWEVDTAYTLISRLLDVGGYGVQDISFVEECSCPEGGVPNWENLDSDKSQAPGKPYNLDEIGQDDVILGSPRAKSIEFHKETWETLSDSTNEFGPDNPSNMPVVEYHFEYNGQTDCQYSYHSLAHFLRSVPEGRKPQFERIFDDTGAISCDPYEPLDN